MARKSRMQSAIEAGLIPSREDNIARRKEIRERIKDHCDGEVVGEVLDIDVAFNEDGTINIGDASGFTVDDFDVKHKADGSIDFENSNFDVADEANKYHENFNAFDDTTPLIDISTTFQYEAHNDSHAALIRKVLGSFTEYIMDDTPPNMVPDEFLTKVSEFYSDKWKNGYGDSSNAIVTAGMNYGNHPHDVIDDYVNTLTLYFDSPDENFSKLYIILQSLREFTVGNMEASDQLYRNLYDSLLEEPDRNKTDKPIPERSIDNMSIADAFKKKLEKKIAEKKQLLPHYVYDAETGKVYETADNYIDATYVNDNGHDIIAVVDYDAKFPDGEIKDDGE